MARRSAASSVSSPPQDMRVWLALGAIYLIWGSTYLAIRLMVETVPPALGAGVRFVAVGVLLLPGGRPDDVPIGMALLILVAALSWALGSFISPRVDLPRDPLTSTAWSLLIGGTVLVAGGLLAGEGAEFDLGAFSA